MTNLRKTYEKSLINEKLRISMWLSKKSHKSYEKLRINLCKTCEKLTTTLQVSYENVKFAAIWELTLCQRLLLVEYFELKITDNQSDDFLRMLSKSDLPFRKSYLADLRKTYENLMTNLGKILQSFENRAHRLYTCTLEETERHRNRQRDTDKHWIRT